MKMTCSALPFGNETMSDLARADERPDPAASAAEDFRKFLREFMMGVRIVSEKFRVSKSIPGC